MQTARRTESNKVAVCRAHGPCPALHRQSPMHRWTAPEHKRGLRMRGYFSRHLKRCAHASNACRWTFLHEEYHRCTAHAEAHGCKQWSFKQTLSDGPNPPATSPCATTNSSTLFNQTATAAVLSPTPSSTAPIINAPKWCEYILQVFDSNKNYFQSGKKLFTPTFSPESLRYYAREIISAAAPKRADGHLCHQHPIELCFRRLYWIVALEMFMKTKKLLFIFLNWKS
jgi:hypothetical protein